MSFQELLSSLGNSTADRDVSSPERSLGVGSPAPRREGLRSGRTTPSAGEEGKTQVDDSRNSEGTAPGSEEHMHKRGRRGELSGTWLRRHPRRLSFDKEPRKTFEVKNLGDQDVPAGISSRKKRKATASRKEPVAKLRRVEQDEEMAVENTRSTRLTRRGNAVTEPSTPPAGENLSKKILEEAERSTDKIEQGYLSEEPFPLDCIAPMENQSENGKRSRGRPRKFKIAAEQATNNENSPKRPVGRPKKLQVAVSSFTPSDGGGDSLVIPDGEKTGTDVGGSVEEKLGHAGLSVTPKRPVGRPKKVQSAPAEENNCHDPPKSPSKSQVSVLVDEEEAPAKMTPESVGISPKRSRGRPRKHQALSTQEIAFSDPAMDVLVEDFMQTIPSVPLENEEEQDPCKLFLEDVEQVYPVENILDAKPDVTPDHPEKASACVTPDATEKTLKRSVGRPRKTKLTFDLEDTDEHPKTEDATQDVEDENQGGKAPVKRPVGRPKEIARKKGVRNQEGRVSNDGSGTAGKRPVGRPKKIAPESSQSASGSAYSGFDEVTKKTGRKRGRPSKKSVQQQSLEESGKLKGARGRGRAADRQGAGAVRAGRSSMKDSSAQETFRRRYLNKVVLDGVEFRLGEDVYVRKSGTTCSESDTEVEDCQVCGEVDEKIMIECDKCLSGFHLTCLDPPLEDVPEDDWVCSFCEAGEKPPIQLLNTREKHRAARVKLLAAELWAARIEKMWRERDGTYWFTARWFLIPEETSTGRQKHTGSRELFRSSQTDNNEMDSILRHCYVMSPDDYKKSAHEGDDVFYCEYEYNERWCRFKRIDYDNHALLIDGNEDDDAYNPSDESEEDLDGEEEGSPQSKPGKKLKQAKTSKAANKRESFSGGIEKVGSKAVVDRPRKKPQSDFEKAKAALTLSAVPPSMPCRDVERTEIAAFLKDSVGAGENCLGHCLYISGVPGTGKTATVREVIKELESKVDAGELPAFRFVEINGLRLPSPDHVYTVLHEALTGQHLGWKKALEFLDERFSSSKDLKGADARPCVLLIDELDVLVNRNQSVLYNIFDWPTRPQSRLVVIGIANTMDLPERMLPRIASRMGMKRLAFSPYSHKQLEEIIASRLDGVQVFDKQAAEFASRKVAAVSGDIRRALELCRRAVEVAEARIAEHNSNVPPEVAENRTDQDENQPSNTVPEATPATGQVVTMADVDAAISQLFEAPQIQMMQRSPKLAKIFLTAMVYEQRRTSVVETTFEKVAATCSELCASNGEEIPDFDTLLGIGCKLGALRLLLCEPGARHKLQKLQLNFPCDDVTFALKDSEVSWLSKYL
ncbi:hypothetical protein Mp_4g18200 [Marchantia polymorpha subsp. ruderalis]|uniref:Origin recognition complex subunit 1 n=2 Tax=Marchantia polymorpha TaxID=3197 RepID=A0AAF6BB65_MARPO|nr:hypothetical protein MARPO_0041s0101 [Marchantia polymorpha]BBN09249.1 hypothetical protein Mp_4g18200 [Marchantia polymorpha subsp. ruderalis]|eukprot:PTQ40237.1 hypothetical protein MARPO_0041s0101 [Marchantia polymorpha]